MLVGTRPLGGEGFCQIPFDALYVVQLVVFGPQSGTRYKDAHLVIVMQWVVQKILWVYF